MTDTAVSIRGLSKRFGERAAVDHLDLEIPAGVIAGFVGPNGAGKTTTQRMLLGLIRPTTGEGAVLGRPFADPAAYLPAVGALIEGPAFYPGLSGRRNLAVLATLGGHDQAEIPALLERVGLAARGDDLYRTYSLGMKQRLGVAAALLGRPDLLILDEPTNGLDPAGMAEMRELVTGLAAGGHTVVLSSHLLAEVQEICDRVGVLSGGRLLTESTVRELRGAAALLVRAEPVERALPAVRAVAGERSVLVTGNGIRVEAGAVRAAEVARAVIAAGADLLELRDDEKSLEEVFFEMTETAK